MSHKDCPRKPKKNQDIAQAQRNDDANPQPHSENLSLAATQELPSSLWQPGPRTLIIPPHSVDWPSVISLTAWATNANNSMSFCWLLSSLAKEETQPKLVVDDASGHIVNRLFVSGSTILEPAWTCWKQGVARLQHEHIECTKWEAWLFVVVVVLVLRQQQ